MQAHHAVKPRDDAMSSRSQPTLRPLRRLVYLEWLSMFLLCLFCFFCACTCVSASFVLVSVSPWPRISASTSMYLYKCTLSSFCTRTRTAFALSLVPVFFPVFFLVFLPTLSRVGFGPAARPSFFLCPFVSILPCAPVSPNPPPFLKERDFVGPKHSVREYVSFSLFLSAYRVVMHCVDTHGNLTKTVRAVHGSLQAPVAQPCFASCMGVEAASVAVRVHSRHFWWLNLLKRRGCRRRNTSDSLESSRPGPCRCRWPCRLLSLGAFFCRKSTEETSTRRKCCSNRPCRAEQFCLFLIPDLVRLLDQCWLDVRSTRSFCAI